MDALQQYILPLVGDDVLGFTAQALLVFIQQVDLNAVMCTRATLRRQLNQLIDLTRRHFGSQHFRLYEVATPLFAYGVAHYCCALRSLVSCLSIFLCQLLTWRLLFAVVPTTWQLSSVVVTSFLAQSEVVFYASDMPCQLSLPFATVYSHHSALSRQGHVTLGSWGMCAAN
jgi:hypothetical protein